MLQASFNIRQEGFERINFKGTNLYIDFGAGHLAFAVMVSTSGRFVGLEFYQLKNSIRQEDLRELLESNSFLKNQFNRVLISYNTKESVLLPEKMYRENFKDQILSSIHGDLNTGVVIAESTDVADMKNIYRIPQFYREEISRLFPGGNYYHVYSTILKILEHRRKSFPPSFIYAIFYPNQIILSVFVDHQLQLIQTFPYDIPEDASYHMLNIADQFELSTDDILVKVCGLIDTESVLYTEIMKYFIHVETDPRPGYFSYDEAFDVYPSHFFTPIFSLGLCV